MSRSYKYRICMFNVDFDDSYNNVLYFEEPSQRRYYFQEHYDISFDNAPLVNFNINDGLNAEVVVNDTKGYGSTSIIENVVYNYCIIQEDRGTEEANYLYYFIKECKYITGSQIKLKLKLDVFTTYPIVQWIDDVPQVQIERAHLNRFVNLDDDTYKFNTASDSLLYIKEDMSFNKRLIDYTSQDVFYNDKQEELIRNWFAKAIKYWVVLFVDPNYSPNDNLKAITQLTLPTGRYKIILYPVMNYGYIWRVTNVSKTSSVELAESTLLQGQGINYNDILKLDETLSAHIIDIRISNIPFWSKLNFSASSMDYSFTKDSEGNSILVLRIMNWTSDTEPSFISLNDLGYWHKKCFFLKETNIGHTERVIISGQEIYTYNSLDVLRPLGITLDGFLKDNIKQYSNNANYNPKRYSNTILDIQLRYGQNEFTYDVFSLGNSNIEVCYYESLGPSIVRSYIYIKPQGLYNENTTKDFLGIVSSNNFSLTYFTEQLSTYIANNKNAWLQTTTKIITSSAASIIKGGMRGASIGGTTGAIAGAASGLVKSAFNAANSAIQYNLNIDNLKSAPASISNIQGDVNLLDTMTNLKPAIELWQALDTDIKTFNDYCLRFGYKVDRMGDLKDYIDIRKYWNYIKAFVEIMPDRFNYKVANEIRDAFDRGIRFWTVQDINDIVRFDYTLPNYEKYLDD